jgi:transaldolase
MFENADSIMRTYVEAAGEFTESANEFLQYVDLMAKAQNAYERASNAYRQTITASAELRNVLEKDDEALRTAMTKLEQAISATFNKTAVEEGKPPSGQFWINSNRDQMA